MPIKQKDTISHPSNCQKWNGSIMPSFLCERDIAILEGKGHAIHCFSPFRERLGNILYMWRNVSQLALHLDVCPRKTHSYV